MVTGSGLAVAFIVAWLILLVPVVTGSGPGSWLRQNWPVVAYALQVAVAFIVAWLILLATAGCTVYTGPDDRPDLRVLNLTTQPIEAFRIEQGRNLLDTPLVAGGSRIVARDLRPGCVTVYATFPLIEAWDRVCLVSGQNLLVRYE